MFILVINVYLYKYQTNKIVCYIFFCFCFVSLRFFFKGRNANPIHVTPPRFRSANAFVIFTIIVKIYRSKSHGVKFKTRTTTYQSVALFQWYTLCSGLIKLWLIYTIIVIKHRFKYSCIYSYTRLITIDKKFKHHILWVCL